MLKLHYVKDLELGLVEEIEIKLWKFPAGESGLRFELTYEQNNDMQTRHELAFQITLEFENNDDLFNLALLVDAIRSMFISPNVQILLECSYFPYARQDRVMVKGESLSLRVVANFIKSLNLDLIMVMDPHSDVLRGMFEPGRLFIIEQHDLVCNDTELNKIVKEPNTFLVSPDAGALKKIYKIAEQWSLPVIECGKIRDVTTGQIKGVRVDQLSIEGPATLIVVDDIIDGGRTFIELAKELRKTYQIKQLILVATHGIFSKGIQVLSDYDKIIAYNMPCGLYDQLEIFNSRKVNGVL